jgi:hypothetical protein
MRSRWTWLITFAVIALSSSGCAGNPTVSVHVRQIVPSSWHPQDVIGVVVVAATETVEQKHSSKVTKCVDRALDGSRAETRTAKVSDMIRNASSGGSLALTEDAAWQALMADADFRQNIAALGLTHLVVVSVSESTGPPTYKTEFGGNGLVFGIDTTSTRQEFVDVQAVVLDLKGARLVARIGVNGTGSSQSGAVFVYFLIPIPHWSSSLPFDPACKKLGMGIARAMVHKTVDPEAVRTCDFVGLVRDDDWDDLIKKVLKRRGNTVLLDKDKDVYTEGLAKKFLRDVEARVYRCES